MGLSLRPNLEERVKGKECPHCRELNIGTRVVSPEEEERLVQNATPFIQDLILFALNTGLRVGEIFTFHGQTWTWKEHSEF